MEDGTAKKENEPSTSKKENERVDSKQDLHNDKRRRDDREHRGGDHDSDSDSTYSGSYISDRRSGSKMDIENARPDGPPQDKTQDKKSKAPQKKNKRGRKPGRVQKRRRTPARRRGLGNRMRRRPRDDHRLRSDSMSTIFSRRSRSRERDRSRTCRRCGHRCCWRRYEDEKRRAESRKRRRLARKAKQKILLPPDVESERLQVGSRCKMLSPLFIDSNATPQDLPEPTCSYCEITPEMIYEAVKSLTMWKQYVLFKPIMDHLKRYYPVNQDDNELELELREKLRVAEIVGIVVKPPVFVQEHWSTTQEHWFFQTTQEHGWSLTCALLQDRALSESHVTRFWQVYADTMSPIKKRFGSKDQLK